MLDVYRLRLLRELSRHGTLAATARQCSLTPSAVSQQLSLLQKQVGTQLFLRDGRRVVLTEAATVLVEHSEYVLAALQRAEAAVAALTSTVTGVLRLAAFPTAARALAPQAIAQCQAAHRGLRITLTERAVPEAISQLRAGHVDVALVYHYNLLPDIRDMGVESETLVTEPLLAALPANLPVRTGSLTLDTLADQPWIAPQPDDELRVLLDRACGLAGFVPRLDFTSSDYTVIFALVQAGLGVSLVPTMALESMSPDIQLREIQEPELSRTVSMVVRAGSRRHPPIAALLAALRTAAEGLSPP